MTAWRALCTSLLCLVSAGPGSTGAQAAQAAPAPSDVEVHELRQRIDALSRQVDQLAAADDAATRQELMQQNWRGLQDYLGWMRGKWGTGSPWMLGTDPVQRPAWLTCPALGGSGAPWLTPEATSPEQ